MFPRTTRNLALVLIGSAVLLTLFVSCSSCTQGYSYYPGGGYYRHRSFFSPWIWSGWGSSSYSANRSTAPSSSPGHATSGSVTSRGGFGGTGHAGSSGG